ncbi:GNAT family N-acetyltransferase [Flavobacteriaceae bacterium MHTCC 0001]
MINFLKAINESHFKILEVLAKTIWQEHYIPIIGESQVSYMLNKFQSQQAIAQQVVNGYEYFIVMFNTENIGYVAVKKEQSHLFLSKLYLLRHYRGKGFGKNTLQFVEQKARQLNCKSVLLTVNKNNTDSITAYEASGFQNLGEIITEIGNGFVMDDYKMQKILNDAF